MALEYAFYDVCSVEEQASGWVDITLSPQAGASDRQKHPQAGCIVILTSQRPPPKQALDWLLAGDRAPNGGRGGSRGPSPTPASRGPTPEPACAEGSTARRGGSSRSPSPHPGAAEPQEQPGAATEGELRQQQGRGDEKSEAAALATQSDRVARRMRYAPPDLDGGAADAAAAATGEAIIESGEMMHQIADCLAEDGEISEAAAEAASLAAEAATCSLVGARVASGSSSGAAVWLEPQDIMEEGQCSAAQPEAQQQQQRRQPLQPGGSRPPTGRDGGGGVAGPPAERLVIACVLRVAPRRDSGGSWVVSAHPRCSAHAAEGPDEAPCAKVGAALFTSHAACLTNTRGRLRRNAESRYQREE